MKISEQEKQQNRQRILKAAADVIIEKSFKSASMREIARRAGIGDATIYNYFPSKERLLYGYCEDVQQRTMSALKEIEDFHTYSLQEQLHQLIETELKVWLPAREFLQQVFTLTYYSPATGITHLAETRRLNKKMVTDMLEAAIEAGEVPDQPYRELLPRLFWDYQTGILAYWLRDTSKDFENTTQLLDKSMGIVATFLQQGLVGKSLDLMSFLFRTHIMSHLDSFVEFNETASKVKRRFMEGDDESKTSRR
ncbi:MAG: TetR/AcrR family transcriptional regulator [bacterium]|nr:TetR/AcrR family transcriptional regulator [bacterium]